MTYTSFSEFGLGWRFTVDGTHSGLEQIEVAKLRPLSAKSAFLVDRLARTVDPDEWHSVAEGVEFEVLKVGEIRETDVSMWLGGRCVSRTTDVVLSWDRENALVCPTDLFLKRWSDFCYSGSDDVTILPSSEEWVLSFRHYDEFRFRARVI